MAVASGNAAQNTTGNILYITKVTTAASQTISSVDFTLTGSYDNDDINSLSLKINNAPTLNGNESNINTTAASASGVGNNMGGLSLSSGVWYIFITAAIASAANVGHTIISSKLALLGLSGGVTDTQTSTGGTKTIS